MSITGVGIDVADLRRIAKLYRERPGFASRWFTEAEIAQALATEEPGSTLGVLFATKEAVWKALALTGGPARLREIEVSGMDVAGVRVTLYGDVRDAAHRRGVGVITVSVDVDGDLAVAIALVGDS